MIKFRQKEFSIQEGGFRGTKVQPKDKSYLPGTAAGAIAGAVIGKGNIMGIGIGAAVGAFTTWMTNIARKSIFNSSRVRTDSFTIINYLDRRYSSTTDPDSEEIVTSSREVDPTTGREFNTSRKTTKNINHGPSAAGIVYAIDDDPKKYALSIYCSGGVLVLYVNNLNARELTGLNEALDSYCSSFKNADYTAAKVGKNSYEVEVSVVDGTISKVIDLLISSGFKLNVITGNRR